MRRIYDSEAIHRDDDDPFSPRETERTRTSHIDWRALSHAFVPLWLRRRAIDVSIETNKREYEPGEPVLFRVTFHNRFPLPISLRTETPIRWQWAIDEIAEASQYGRPRPPNDPSLFVFGRGERKVYTRRWSGKIRRDKARWEAVDDGPHELSVWICVNEPGRPELSATTTVQMRN